MSTLLNMAGIGKAFSGVRVLENVSFDLKLGEVHVLAGENGAGKSTLMNILSGVHRDYSGTISLNQIPVHFSSPYEASRNGIAMIHQELSLINSLSVADNIFLGRELARSGAWLKRNEQNAIAKKAMMKLALDIDVRRPVGEFPVSVQQMIEIARALNHEARILIMDEPTSSLNDPEVNRLFDLVNDLKRQCGIIYITHKMDEIYQVADRITVLRDGRHIITEVSTNLPKNELVKKMVGRDLAEQFPARQVQSGNVVLEVKDFSTPHFFNKRVSFNARSGEIVGFAGLQGAGNSELFHGLSGSYGPVAEGAVKLNGKPYLSRSPSHAIASRLALLTNDRKQNGLVSGMSSVKNMTLASVKKVSTRGWIRRSRERTVAEGHRKKLNIRMSEVHQDVNELSGGNQQKVVLAKWLETDPRVLLLDEPTRGVDIGAKHEIYEWMNRWTDEGGTILLISSELQELMALSDRILVMHRGVIRAEFSREDATREKIVQAAMGVGG